MKKFKKKPVEVEAICWDGTKAVFNEIFANGGERSIHWLDSGELTIGTLEGVMKANMGDWIIKGLKGELYPCKPDIFKATYIEVKS